MALASIYRPGLFHECWQFRGFIAASVKRDFTSRYLGTGLGWFWAIAQPLALILIYTLVFAEIMRPAMPGYDSRFAYSIYLCSGLILWQLFSDLVNRCVSVFVQNAGLLKKVNVPKLALPIIAALSGLASFAIIAVLFLAFLGAIGHFPWPAVLAMIPVIALMTALAVGIGVLLGTINVFYRDVEQSTSMVLQFWFWLTPIVYPGRAVPDFFAAVLSWNPMWPIVSFSQSVFLDQRVPSWSTLTYPGIVALAAIGLAWIAFRKLSGEIVDEL